MWKSRHLKATLLVCAVAITVLAGARSVTNAAGGVEPLVAADVSYDQPVHRDGRYPVRGEHQVVLRSKGGRGPVVYEIVEQPTSAGVPVGRADVSGDAATITIDPSVDPGPASFSYRAHEPDGRRSDVATVSFDIENRAPLTRDLPLSTPAGTALEVYPFARDAEHGGPFPWLRPANRVRYGKPTHGTVRRLRGPGVGHKAVYRADDDYVGRDTFPYMVRDADGSTSSGTVAVDVTQPQGGTRNREAGVLYRCVPESDRVARRLGGDLTVRVRARDGLPDRLRAGRAYADTSFELDLTLSKATTDLLAGDDEHDRLESAGLGQSAFGAAVEVGVGVRKTATGNAYAAPVTGLRADTGVLDSPSPADGATVSASGVMRGLSATRRGELVLSMPRSFDLDGSFEPGLGDGSGAVAMACRAVPGQPLEFARIPVLPKM